jgi:hypothetical protein
MRGAALASFDKQFPFDQIKQVSVCGVVGYVECLATPTAGAVSDRIDEGLP